MVAKNKEISYCRQQYKVKTGKWMEVGDQHMHGLPRFCEVEIACIFISLALGP